MQIWTLLLEYIFRALQFLYGWVNDYGFAIILLTIAFRIVLIPLTWKQTKSMYELQAIQPKIKALQEKYKNNKEKQQEELMKFYQENKVNPFGGCLPLLLQMPLFIALFTVLRKNLGDYIKALPPAAELVAKRFWVILPDITKTPQQIWGAAAKAGIMSGIWAVLPYAIFVVLFGLSVWLPQYLMTKDPTQRRTGAYMAVMMLWFGWVSPAGVLIYWVTSSGWQVGQQLVLQRMLSNQGTAADTGVLEVSKPTRSDKDVIDQGPAPDSDRPAKSPQSAKKPQGKTGGGSKKKSGKSKGR